MSNHSGSYMLNEVLCTAKDMGIFETIGKEKAQEFALIVIIRKFLKILGKNWVYAIVV